MHFTCKKSCPPPAKADLLLVPPERRALCTYGAGGFELLVFYCHLMFSKSICLNLCARILICILIWKLLSGMIFRKVWAFIGMGWAMAKHLLAHDWAMAKHLLAQNAFSNSPFERGPFEKGNLLAKEHGS